jgi:hypothetical protein
MNDDDTPPLKPTTVESPVVRLNVFGLPSRTTLLFLLIVLVIALPIAATLFGGTPICVPFVFVGMLILPLRDFLRQPDEIRRAYATTDAHEHFPTLSQRWNALAVELGLKPPRLVLTKKNIGGSTFGSFTRRYAVVSETLAKFLERWLKSFDEKQKHLGDAFLIHELAHFLHRDVWMVGFSQSLLRVTIAFIALNYVVSAMTPFLYNALVSFFDFSQLLDRDMIEMMQLIDPRATEIVLHPPKIQPATWMNYEAVLLAAHAPLVLGSIILLVFYWRALLRTRELYADARVVARQGTEAYLWNQLQAQSAIQRIQPPPGTWWGKATSWVVQWRMAVGLRLRGVAGWLGTHPSLKMRQKCLSAPHTIYGDDWAIGVTAGVTVVLLNLTLGSLFLSRYIRGPNSQVPFIIGFLVISLSLLPTLCQFPARVREQTRQITRVVALFTAIKLIPQYLVGIGLTTAMLIAPQLMDQAAWALVGGAGIVPESLGIPVEFVLETFVVRPAILFTIGMPIVLILWLRLDAHIRRQLLRWYSSPWMIHHPSRTLWGTTILLAIILGLVVLPVLDVLTIPTAHDLFAPLTISGIILGVVLAIIGFALLHIGNKRYSQRCPSCATMVEGAYRLGKQCPSCNTLFHPKLCLSMSLESSGFLDR